MGLTESLPLLCEPDLLIQLLQHILSSLHSTPDLIITMAERYIPEHRRTQFKAKNTFKPDELRRRREEQQVEIRRQKREENIAKRRGIQRGDGQIGIGGQASADSDDEGVGNESEVSDNALSDCACVY